MRHSVLLWVIYFCYAVTAALLLQKLVLPMLPSLHAGHGLLHNDAILFHQEATALADSIREHGWGVWSFWPRKGGSGNVAILAALYVWFGPDPALLIPINAALHALGGILLFLIGYRLWPGRVGLYGGLTASVLFVLFPSSLVWYGQIHKDSFSIAGVLLVVYALLRAMRAKRQDLLAVFGCAIAGIVLIAIVRPYYFKMLTVAGLAVWLVTLLLSMVRSPKVWTIWAGPLIIIALLGMSSILFKSDNLAREGEQYAHAGASTKGFVWERSSFMPEMIEHQAELVGRTRFGLMRYNHTVGARTLIDDGVVLRSDGDIIAYAPRALQVAAFSPFPTSWLSKISLPVMLGVAETAVWYLFVPGIVIALLRRCTPEIVAIMVFACVLLTILGLVEPNVGTLFRYRYTYILLLLLIGALGWASLWPDDTAELVMQKKAT